MAKGETYEEFVAKFERAAARTTDDCYTPPETYAAILEWVRARYDLPADCTILRPFFPGGDYEHADYPPGAVVVDNPPFSLHSKIIRFFASRGIKYFIFCDGKTALNSLVSNPSTSIVFSASRITYENGAIVPTAFATNLEPPGTVLCAPTLYKAISAACAEIRKGKPPKTRKKIIVPKNIIKFSNLDAVAAGGVELRLGASDYAAVRDACGRHQFGSALIVGDSLADKIQETRRLAAQEEITLELTEKDRAKIAALNAKEATPRVD